MHDIFDEEGNLKTGKEYKKFWEDICSKKFHNKINPKTIICNILQYRNELEADLKKKFVNEKRIVHWRK